MNRVAPYLKALTAALVAGLSVLLAASSESLTTQDYLQALVAFLVGLGAVWAVPNKTSS